MLALHKRYGAAVALDDCTFSVERERVLGFLGRNGAGKTTAMRSIFGLVRLDAGSIRWEGRPVDRDARMRFGYMPEERGLYPRMTVEDQLRYFGRLRGLDGAEAASESWRWMERLDLSDRRASSLDSLSHGNQQKVQLGVSLVGQPDLLVLDEPFSGLDPFAVEVLASVIKETAAHGAAVVFSSHQLELVGGICDDIAVVTHGHVVLHGNLDAIRRSAPTRTLALTVDGAADSMWAIRLGDDLPGSHLVESNGNHAVLAVPSDMRPADILAAMGEVAGQVIEFRLEPPDLETIFRRAVGEPA